MTLKISTIEKWLPAIATLWFLASLDSVIMWNALSPVIHIFTTLFIMWGTMLVKPIDLSSQRRILFLSVFVFSSLYIVTQSDNLIVFIKRVCLWLPFVFIIFWDNIILSKTYNIIRKVVVFFAVGASVVSLLTFVGLINMVPHFVVPPQEALHVRLGYSYHVYGLFVSIQDPLGFLAYRACGMMMEPGHFAVVLGFVYMIDRYQERKINWWIVLCGILTFSANFPLFVLFTEWRFLFKMKKLLRFAKWLPIVLLGSFVLYTSLPKSTQDNLYGLAFGRNLEKVVDVASSSSSMDDALDVRANNMPLMVYNRMSFSEKIFGIGRFDTAYCLSDYRGMIMTLGWVGLLLSVSITVILVWGIRKDFALSLVMAFSLILLHRSWMLFLPYVNFLSFLAISIVPYRQRLNIEHFQSYGE